MSDTEIGFVELTTTTRIIFSVGSWKGKSRGGIRKFIASDKYSGPTKSGLSLDGATVVQLLAALRTLQSTVPTKNQNQHISVAKIHDWEIRITIIPPDEDSALPSVDIREFVETPSYAGPTKKGVRFGWDKLKQFAQLVEVLVQQLGAAVSAETTLFPDVQPQWITDSKQTSGAVQEKPAQYGLDATTLKTFPDSFLPEGKFAIETVTLPSNRLRIAQNRDGHYLVTDDSDFDRRIRNEVEGKFLLYAQLRGHTELRLPREMFKVFSAVAGYEKYCRELRTKIVRDLETRSGNRNLAEHIARESLEAHGMPYV